MNAMRDLWSDERLDDLNHRVDEGFNRNEREFQAVRLEMRTEFAAVRGEMKEEFGAVRSEMKEEFAAMRSEMREEFGAVRAELKGEVGGLRGEVAALNRTLIQIGIGGLITLIAGVAGVILAQLL